MSRFIWGTIAVALISYTGVPSAQAQTEWGVDVEALFMQMSTNVGTATAAAAPLDPGVRVTLNRTGEDGAGFRLAYFNYSTAVLSPPSINSTLQTYNIDFEVYQRLYFLDRISFELHAGLRGNDTEFNFPTQLEPSDFTGVGGIVGLRGGLRVFGNGELYARSSFCILAGKGGHDSNFRALPIAFNLGRSQTEIAIGYQHTLEVGRFEIVPRIGAEWQSWNGFVPDVVDEHPESNFVLGGITFGLGVNF